MPFIGPGQMAHVLKNARGYAVTLRFAASPEANQRTGWNTREVRDAMQSLSKPHLMRTMEFWRTADSLQIIMWAPTKRLASQLANSASNFNPSIRPARAPTLFPPIPADAWFDVGQLIPWRNAHHCFEYRFGQQRSTTHARGGEISPLMHVLRALPDPPDGATLVIQICYHKEKSPWRWNPGTWAELTPFRGYDLESLEAKKRDKEAFGAGIRILEVHPKKPRRRQRLLADMPGLFRVTRLPGGNKWIMRDMPWPFWTRRRRIAALTAMIARRQGPFKVRGWRRPHLSVDELAAIVHPPPEGIRIPHIHYLDVSEPEAAPDQLRRSRAIQEEIRRAQQAKRPTQASPGLAGTTRRLRASDIPDHADP